MCGCGCGVAEFFALLFLLVPMRGHAPAMAADTCPVDRCIGQTELTNLTAWLLAVC